MVNRENKLFCDKRPLLIAHRGYTPIAPENSLPSFLTAAKLGYWAIETDVHRTLDGVLVCCHDYSLQKMYGSPAVIEEATYAELKDFRVCRGNGLENFSADELRLPLFEEYLDICASHGCVPFIETKGDVVEAVLHTVEKRGLTDTSVLSSARFAHIEEARRLSDIFVHHIFSTPELMCKISEMGNGGLSYNYPNLDDVPSGLIEQTHAMGVKVCLRAGDDEETLAKMMAMRLDYIPTNRTLPR